MAVTALDGGQYTVTSHSGATYLVDLPNGDCTCPDHEIRGERCKHLRRVAIEVTEGRVPPPGRRRGTCLVCGRPSFVPETAPAVCTDCRLERGDLATDRETGETVVVYRWTEKTAAERYIEATDCTVAEYRDNKGYPPTDPVVEVVYPFSGDRDAGLDDRPRYAFPRSRLGAREGMLLE